ncbi:MAG: isopenicillin N synthase-like dioxygenase [Gammaproteobacteria bacterium]|jgi:isopenicillin N synthase-like dioxygenase
MTNAESFEQIPIVDLGAATSSPAARRKLAAQLGDICHRIGFLVITGHGVAPSTIANVFEQSNALFDLPLEQKKQVDKRQSRHFRGWEPVGAESTNNRTDFREQVDIWTEHPARAEGVSPAYLRLLGPNQWLPDTVLAKFQPAVRQWLTEVAELADRLMALLALSLELAENHFDQLFGVQRMSLTKLIRYPATPAGQFGVNAHHDTGFLTVLAPGQTLGLEVQNESDAWIPVPLISDALVVNLGEMLQAMTGHYFVATAHRVRTDGPRHSIGYFHGPALDTELRTLPLAPRFHEAVAASPRHAHAGYMAQRAETNAGVPDMSSPHRPDTYGDQLWNYFARSYPDNMALHYPRVQN